MKHLAIKEPGQMTREEIINTEPWQMTKKQYKEALDELSYIGDDWGKAGDDFRWAAWQLPEEALKRSAKSPDYWMNLHKERIQQALSEGKPVPPEVLEDYPDLQYEKGFKEVFPKGVPTPTREQMEHLTDKDPFNQLKKNLQTIADKICEKYGVPSIKIETSDISAKGKAVYHTVRIKGGKINFPKDITIYQFKEIANYPGEIIHDLAHELSHHILNIKMGTLQHTSKQGELEDEIGLFISRNFKNLLNKQQLNFKHLD